jgi:AraC-like DNA-binding protein
MSKTVDAPSELDFLSSLFKPNFIKFEEVIQNNQYANLTLEELAALCHMSLSSFKRKFQAVYNDSPIKYLSKKKLLKAAELLKDKTNRISDIAYDVGFESLSTFNRAFKAQYGKSPSEYRLS